MFKSLTRRQKAIYMVLLTVSIDTMASSMLLAVMTKYAQAKGGGEAYVGATYSLYSAGAVIASFLGPPISDRIGKKTTFLCTITGMASGYLFQALSTSFDMFLIARTYGGLFAYTISNTFAYISDVATAHERSGVLSMVGGLISICMIIGPVVGSGLSAYGLNVPFYAAAVVCVVNLAITWQYLPKPETLLSDPDKEHLAARAASFKKAEHKISNIRKRLQKQETHRNLSAMLSVDSGDSVDPEQSPNRSSDVEDSDAVTTRDSIQQSALPGPWTRPQIVFMGLVSFFNYACFATVSVLLPLLLSQSKFGLAHGEDDDEGAKKVAAVAGYWFAGLGFVSAPVMIFLAPFLQRHFGMIFAATIGAVLLGLGMFLMVLPSSIAWTIPCLALIGVGNGLVYPTIPAFMAAQSLPAQHAETLAVGQVFQQFASVVGPLATFLFAISPTLAFMVSGGSSYMNIVILSALAAMMYQHTSGSAAHVYDPKLSASAVERAEKHIAKKPEEFITELQSYLIDLLKERNYELNRWRVQYAVKETITNAFPSLRPGPSPEHEEDIRALLRNLGHSDFTDDVRIQEQNKLAFANMMKYQQ